MRNHSHRRSHKLARDGGSRRCKPGHNPARRKKQRDESRLQQHAVGLIAGEILRRGDEGKKTDKADGKAEPRPDIQERNQRCDDPDPDHQHHRTRTRRNPEQRGHVPKPGRAEILRGGAEVVARRQKALRPDQSFDLEKQRVESRKVNERQRAQKDPSRQDRIARAKLRVEPLAKDLKCLLHGCAK